MGGGGSSRAMAWHLHVPCCCPSTMSLHNLWLLCLLQLPFSSHMPHAACQVASYHTKLPATCVEHETPCLTSAAAATVRGRTRKSTALPLRLISAASTYIRKGTLSASGQSKLARSCTNSIIKPFNLYSYVQLATRLTCAYHVHTHTQSVTHTHTLVSS